MEKNIPIIYMFPNCVDIFTYTYTDEDFDGMSQDERLMFALSVFPIIKHRWRKAQVILDGKTFKLSIEPTKRKHKYPSANDLDIFNYSVDEDVKRKIVKARNGSVMSQECYAFMQCRPGTYPTELSDIVLRGLMHVGNKLRIFSAKVGNQDNTIGVLGNSLPFSKVPLASLKESAQREIFRAWITKHQIVLTGGTGVGKTSQIPKLIMWFNYLFGGFDNLETISAEFRERSVVLSLPRVALVKLHGQTYLEALGFTTWSKSPIALRFGNMTDDYINHKHPNYGIVISTHRLVLSSFDKFDTIIVDEVHEHDQIGDIVIAISRKYAHTKQSLILMTATLDDDRDRLQEYLPSPEFIHIPGKTLYPISEVYIKNTSKVPLSSQYTTEEIKNVITAINRYRPMNGFCGILFVATVSQCEVYADHIKKAAPWLSVHIIHGKINNIADILQQVYEYNGVSLLVSTPYLESSITVKTVTHIYDTGRVFIPAPYGGHQRIISRSMRDQRKGRVGRVMPGIYIYFYDISEMKPVKLIDYQHLHLYVLYSRLYSLSIPEDLFIVPSTSKRLDDTIEYLDSFGIPLDKWKTLLSNYYMQMIEYARVYARGGNDANMLDQFERTGVLTDEVVDILKGLDLKAKIISIRPSKDKYYLTCEVMFGIDLGTRFRVTHKLPLQGYILMVSETTFVPLY